MWRSAGSGPVNPRALNRYAYALNNPLKYTDPTGHCPAPTNDSGHVICVDFFIQTHTIIFGTGKGDGRGFDPNSHSAESRAYFYLYLDERGVLQNVVSHINPSCVIVVGCFQPLNEHNVLIASQDPDTLDITLSWNLTNGVSSHLLRLSEDIYRAEADIGSMAIGSTLVGFIGRMLPAINGTLTLSLSADGQFNLSRLNRDPYPSLEIYHYYNGALQYTIARLPECDFVGNLGPFIWLNPLARNETR